MDRQVDDLLACALAAYQQRLEAGHPRNSTAVDLETEVPSELRHQLKEQMQCLDLLHALRGSQPASLAADVECSEGALPKGRFQRLDELGSGGFGIVWRARDPATGRIVALKVPRPEVLASVELRKRFEQEAEAAARLDHPNIVPILEAGTDGLVPYIASTYYEGPTLAAWLREHTGSASPRFAAEITLALAKALAHAHARGVLHRDVKPSNILLVPNGRDADARELTFEPKLMDFGLAKLGETDQDLTRTGAMLGTLRYMAPEQAAGRSKEITAGTDIYGLGVVLYEMLAGAPPFSAESDWLTLRQVLETEPRSLTSIRRDVPFDLGVIVHKCLCKEVSGRYRTARELADDLERYLDGRTIHARPTPVLERLAKWCRRKPAFASLIAVTVIAMLSGLAFLSYSNLRIAAALAREKASREQLSVRLYAADVRRAGEALDQGHVARTRELLQPYADSTSGQDLREFAWNFLWRRLPHQKPFTPKHAAPVYGLCLSPNDELAATGCADGCVRVWRRGAEQPEQILECQQAEVNEVIFSPDGQWLAAACEDGLTRIWDTADWSLRHELPIGGVITTDYFGRFDSSYGMAVQENGMIVTVGQSFRTRGNSDAYVSRYKPNGQIDGSFNEHGDAIVWRHTEPDNLSAVFVDPDGKIVAGGTAFNDDFAIARLLPDGSHDLGFGDGGEVLIDVGSTADQVQAAIRQPDGKYLLAGQTKRGSDFDAAIVRLNPDGSLDETFGGGGKLIAYSGPWDDIIHSLALQGDGKLVAVGCTSATENTSESGDTLVIRCDIDGTPDLSFGKGGALVLKLSESLDRARSVAVQPDGKIVLVGESRQQERPVAFAARSNPDGAFDEGFGEHGVVLLDREGSATEFRALTLQPDGKMLAVGAAGEVAHRSALLARFNADGSLDESFSTAGQFCMPIGIGSELNAVALLGDGKIVVSGQVLCGGDSPEHFNFLVARFHPNGALDRTFSPNGAEGIKFLPDSRRLIVHAQQCLQLWDVTSGERLTETFVPEFSVEAATMSADGQRLVTAGERFLATWDVTAMSVPLESYRLSRAVSALASLATEKSLAIGRSNGELVVLDKSWEEKEAWERTEEMASDLRAGKVGDPKAIRVSPDSELLAAVYGNSVLIYRTTDWTRVAEIATQSRVFDVQFRKGVRAVVTTGSDGTVMEWPLPAQGEKAFGDAGRRIFIGTSKFHAMALSRDEKSIACGQGDGRIVLVDTSTGQVQFDAAPLSNRVNGLGFSVDDRELIVGYASGAVVSVNLQDHSTKTLRTLGHSIRKLIVSADGSRIAVALEETSKLRVLRWPLARDVSEINFRGNLVHMAFTWSGKQIVVSGGPFLDVYDASSGKFLGGDAELGVEHAHLQVCQDDARIVVAEGTKGIAIRELPSCKVRKRMLGGEAGIQCIAVSADGRNIASAGQENVLRIWDTETSESLLTLRDEPVDGYLRDMQFSRDGRKLFGISGPELVVWEAQ